MFLICVSVCMSRVCVFGLRLGLRLKSRCEKTHVVSVRSKQVALSGFV